MQRKTVFLFQKSEKHFKYLNDDCLFLSLHNILRIINPTTVTTRDERGKHKNQFF